jgi:hypothetical protein
MKLPTQPDKYDRYMEQQRSGIIERELLRVGAAIGQQPPHYERTAAEIAASVTPTAYEYPPGDVRRYGAVGDGVTNDSAAIQAALNLQHPVIMQPVTYKINTGLTWNLDYGIIHANGAILTTDQDIDGLVIGALGSGNVLQGCRIYGSLYLINTGTSTKSGFEFRQVYEGRFEIGAQGWNKGIHLTSSAAGTVYNEFYLGRVTDNNYGIHLNPTSGGWVNENNFYGGRYACFSGSKQYLVYAPDSGSTYGRPNNNKFFGPSFENGGSSTMVGAVYDAGVGNVYYSPRIEMGGTISDVDFCFGTRAVAGTLILPYASYQATGNVANNIRDDGIESIIWTTDRFKMVSRQAAPASAVQELWRHDGNNSSLPTQEIVDAYDTSQQSMGTLYRLARAASAQGYAWRLLTMGSIVLASNGREYECIAAHTSSATDEPGVGVNWETYWRRLPTASAAGGVSWAVSTAYSAPFQRAQVSSVGEGELRNLVLREAAIATDSGDVSLGTATQTTVGAAGAASALPAQPTGYLRFFIGATEFVMPYYARA